MLRNPTRHYSPADTPTSEDPMGTTTLVTEAITFNPPVTWPEIITAFGTPRTASYYEARTATGFVHDAREPEYVIARQCALRLDTERELTPDGREIITRTVTAITGIPGGDRYKAYDLKNDVQEIARALALTPEGRPREFDSYLECQDDDGDDDDRWRVYIRSGYAEVVHPELRYTEPEGASVAC